VWIDALQTVQNLAWAAFVTIVRRLRGTAWLADRNGAADLFCTEVRMLHFDVCIAAAIAASQSVAISAVSNLSLFSTISGEDGR
jgi:hypothetical protein